ncbi:S8 family peptidase, partial [bacterium]|nr:S8 family peptidase [bacterium]
MKEMKKYLISIGLIMTLLVVIFGSDYASPPPQKQYLILINPALTTGIMRAIDASGGKVTHVYNSIPNILAIRIPEKALQGISHMPGIVYTEVDAVAHAVQEELPWGVDRIDAELVHPENKGTGVPVAVIDTGIDSDHPDLAGNYNGGYDFVNGDNDPNDDEGHGTHVAGTIAAEDNDEGVIGAAPEASLYALKVLDSNGSGYYSDIIAALDWCVSNNISVANMSLGGGFRSRALEQACKSAYNAGVLLVAAAGNENSRSVLYPAEYNSVIAVAATDESDSRAWFSNYGSAIELAAPGVNILSTALGGGYVSGNGTSMSTPHVSGTAALVYASGVSKNFDVRARLQSTAEDLGEAGKDNYFGYGLVDAEAAVSGGVTPPPPPPGEEIVTITKLTHDSRKQELSIEATSSDAPARTDPALAPTLTVTGDPILPNEPIEMELDSKKGKYSVKVTGVSVKPNSITVTSSNGGSATTLEIRGRSV